MADLESFFWFLFALLSASGYADALEGIWLRLYCLIGGLCS